VISALQVVLTPTHLGIVMEYAAGGELFERICSAGRFSEDEVCLLSLFSFVHQFFFHFSTHHRHGATYLPSLSSLLATECLEIQLFDSHYCYLLLFQARYFFQQLISGVSYCHSMVNIIIILGMSCFGW